MKNDVCVECVEYVVFQQVMVDMDCDDFVQYQCSWCFDVVMIVQLDYVGYFVFEVDVVFCDVWYVDEV